MQADPPSAILRLVHHVVKKKGWLHMEQMIGAMAVGLLPCAAGGKETHHL